MDTNNVIVIINSIQGSNPLIDCMSSLFGNTIISVIGGIFAAIISVYITIEYTVIKSDSIKYNKTMLKVIFEVKQIKRKMAIGFFKDQIKKMHKKAEQKKNGEYIWVGFDKEDYGGSFIVRYQYLPIFWLSFFVSQAFELLLHEDNEQLKNIQLIQSLYRLAIEYNNNLQFIESQLNNDLNNQLKKRGSFLNKSDESLSLNFDPIVENSIQKISNVYDVYKFRFDELIDQINPENEEKLLLKVKFWPSVKRSLVKN